MRQSLIFLLAIVCVTIAAPISASPETGFEVQQYNVAIRPNLQTTAVSGTETIILRGATEGLKELTFSPNAMRISDATLDGKALEVRSDEQAITFLLPRPLQKGRRATLRFRFEGVPKRGVTAAAGGIYSSYFACDWMVCLQDSPGDKAHLQLDLLLPPGLESLGVGRANSVSPAADGLTLHRWRSTRPTSPYLYAFAAGKFARYTNDTTQGRLSYLNMTGADADLPKLFRETPDMVAFFADKAGLPLPDRGYVQLFVPGDAAQESASFSLIGKAVLDAETSDPGTAWVIAHELAHQYWGNLVTCATWQDFWLNEGIATFMTAAWTQHSAGEDAYQQELNTARRRVARVRELGFDKPLTWGGKYPTLRARRAVQYSKGALFLAHLREQLGDATFWNGLKQFTQKHAGGTVTSKDFQTAMEQASGKDLSPMFGEWVYGIAPLNSQNSSL